MNLTEVLALVGMNRDSYNTLRKQNDRLTFMERDIEGVTAQDRFNPSHALALTVFLELRDMGAGPGIAGVAVYDSFHDIKALTENCFGRNNSERCGFRKTHLGVFETLGHPRKDTDPARIVSETYVNLREVWDYLQTQMGAA